MKKADKKRKTTRAVQSEPKQSKPTTRTSGKNKEKLAGEVYDLLVRKHDPTGKKGLPAGLPSRENFIKTNVAGFGGVKPTSKADLERYKKELQTELGITPTSGAPSATKQGKAGKPVQSKTPKSKTPKKSAAVQKPAKPTKTEKPAARTKKLKASKKAKLKPIKHSDAEENKIGAVSPIIIKRDSKPKPPRHRVLKRVAKSGGYTAFDGARAGKTFATPSEAANYAAYVFACTGKVIEVAPTSRQITHTFEPEEQKKKK